MALADREAVCGRCQTAFNGRPKRTFLGFQKLDCPNCEYRVLHPLTSGYRAIYWGIVAIFLIMFLASLAAGTIAFPNLWVLAIIWALDKDRRVRKEVGA